VTHSIAEQIGAKRYAIINTDYVGGIGSQAAVVYDHGNVSMETQAGGHGVINKALRMLGVERVPGGERLTGYDEFDSIGLGKYRDFDDYFVKYRDE